MKPEEKIEQMKKRPNLRILKGKDLELEELHLKEEALASFWDLVWDYSPECNRIAKKAWKGILSNFDRGERIDSRKIHLIFAEIVAAYISEATEGRPDLKKEIKASVIRTIEIFGNPPTLQTQEPKE